MKNKTLGQVTGDETTHSAVVLEIYTIAEYENGGRVEKYINGMYNENDIVDLEKIAKIKAETEGVRVQIQPIIDSPKDVNYGRVFPELVGTEYEGKCPDLRVITNIDEKTYVEYESFEKKKPFKMRKVYHMLKHGAAQASNIVLDIRGTTVTSRGVKGRVEKLKGQKDFTKKIEEVWLYDGKKLKNAYKNK